MGVQPQIELRLSDVEPPDADPPRTIYRDMYQLPDPVLLGITVRYYNYDAVQLWFRITGEGAGYTFTPEDLGPLAAGTNAYENLDEFASRAKPSAEASETIKLILQAYEDAGYTTLKWTYERTVQLVWIDSSDASYTVDELDNFDDGTVQGWAAFDEANNAGGFPTLEAAVDFVLSPPNSAKMTSAQDGYPVRSRLWKNFTTPNRDTIYAIMDVRNAITGASSRVKNLRAQRDAVVLVYLGEPVDLVLLNYIPVAKWMRIVMPLPKNTNLDVRIVQEERLFAVGDRCYLWLDDFKIISK